MAGQSQYSDIFLSKHFKDWWRFVGNSKPRNEIVLASRPHPEAWWDHEDAEDQTILWQRYCLATFWRPTTLWLVHPVCCRVVAIGRNCISCPNSLPFQVVWKRECRAELRPGALCRPVYTPHIWIGSTPFFGCVWRYRSFPEALCGGGRASIWSRYS